MLGWGYTTPAPVALLVTWWKSSDIYVVDGISVTAQQKQNSVTVTFDSEATEEQRNVVTDIIRPLAYKNRVTVSFL